ncbi:metalloregulator ArsR/SmtB family transcription factor [Microbacterium sp. MTN4-26]|uniref:metalloregulator ArsR/SmtB family transcription factor n=1 Tax=unclassified Microbacterium TaxID=2609290 RepID=UPI0036F42F15
MVTTLDVTDITAIAETGADSCCTSLVREPMTAEEAESLALTMKALADPARLRLLSIVAASENSEAWVCDLIEPIGLSQPTVSHHLKVLTAAGFLTRSKRATWAYFTLVPGALDRVSRFFATA